MIDRRVREHTDWTMIWVTVGLASIGVLNLYSATVTPNGPPRAFFAQLIFVTLGIVVMAVTTLVDYRALEQFAYAIWGFVVLALVAVLFFGVVRHGSRSWIDLGFFDWQPMELAKIAVIIALARWFHNSQKRETYDFWELWQPALLVVIPVALVALQPDWGGALLLSAISASIILYVGMRPVSLAIVSAASGGVAAVLYLFALTERQRGRILVFLNPELDPLGSGYNAIQSKVAVGSGQLVGRGFLNGTQSKLQFLPAHHTDFVFSVLAEEWGFLGSVFVVITLFALLLLGIRVVFRAKDRFGALLAFGIVAMFFWQIFVNIGGALGLVPVTGVTLPFMSYGGSSMVLNFMAVGLLLNVSMRRFMF